MPKISKGNLVMAEIRTGDFYDPWGLAMGWLFAIAEVAYVEYDELFKHFSPSCAIHTRNDLEDYEHEMLLDLIDAGQVDLSDLEYAYTIMDRYAQLCKLAGKDY